MDKYLFTKENMPLVYKTSERILDPIKEKIAFSLPLTWETLCLVDAIKSKIPQLTIIPQSSDENSSTQPGVFSYLKKWNIAHYLEASEINRIEILRQKPEIIVDCSFVLGEAGIRNGLLSRDTLVIEDTKTGENRIEELGLKNPYIILDNSHLKREYENRIGIGYSVMGALMSAGFFLPKYNIGIIGYGKVGEGVAKFAKSLGANVAICEIDETRKLKAASQFPILDKKQLLEFADLVITATGKPGVICREDLAGLNKKLLLANAGGEDEWIRSQLFKDSPLLKIHPHVSKAQIGGCDLLEVGGGNSVNLALGVSISEFLDITFSQLIAVLAQLKYKKLQAGKNDISAFRDPFLDEKVKSLGLDISTHNSVKADKASVTL